MENKCKKAKWLSEEVLQIAVKWREGKTYVIDLLTNFILHSLVEMETKGKKDTWDKYTTPKRTKGTNKTINTIENKINSGY